MRTSKPFFSNSLLILLTALIPLKGMAFTIQGRISNAKSAQIFLHSSWKRKDTLALDATGYFQATIAHSPYEKVFSLQWVAEDGYGRYLSMLVEPEDVVRVEARGKKEKLNYLKGDLKRKDYLHFLLEKTSGLDHRLPGLKRGQREVANQEIFRYLDTLFVQEPLLAVECIGFMRYTLFTDDFRWRKMPKIWEQLNAIPDSIKLNSKIYQELNTHFWPGKTMLDLMFQDASQGFHRTDEFRDKPLLLIFENADPSSILFRSEVVPYYDQLKGTLHVLSLAEEPYLEEWQERVKAQPLPWTQGFLVADETMTSLQLLEYFHGTPRSVLLDQNRKIIAFNPELEAVISFVQNK